MSDTALSYGRVPKEAIQAAINSPYGCAQDEIQKFVPDFVLRRGDCLVFDVEVKVQGTEVIRVSAPSKEHAKALADDEHYPSNMDLSAEYRVIGKSEKQDSYVDFEWDAFHGENS